MIYDHICSTLFIQYRQVADACGANESNPNGNPSLFIVMHVVVAYPRGFSCGSRVLMHTSLRGCWTCFNSSLTFFTDGIFRFYSFIPEFLMYAPHMVQIVRYYNIDMNASAGIRIFIKTVQAIMKIKYYSLFQWNIRNINPPVAPISCTTLHSCTIYWLDFDDFLSSRILCIPRNEFYWNFNRSYWLPRHPW